MKKLKDFLTVQSWLKELSAVSLAIILIVAIILLNKGGQILTTETILYIVLLNFIATAISILRIRYQFPGIDFSKHIEHGNLAAAKVVNSIIIADAILIGCSVIALAWI